MSGGSTRIHPLPRARIVLLVGIGVGIFYEILAMRVRTNFVEGFQIPSSSMYPTLQAGDHMFVRKTSRAFTRGDVVVFRYPLDHTIDYVKRIVAVGGDVVTIRGGQLSINGRPVERRRLDEPCTREFGYRDCTQWRESLDGREWSVAEADDMPRDFGPSPVPEGEYFLLGDNRDNSSDSRMWGPVAAELIKGKAQFVWWSSDNGTIRWNRINQPVR